MTKNEETGMKIFQKCLIYPVKNSLKRLEYSKRSFFLWPCQ